MAGSIGGRSRLEVEVSEDLVSAHQGRAVTRARRLTNAGGDVPDRESDPTVAGRICARAVHHRTARLPTPAAVGSRSSLLSESRSQSRRQTDWKWLAILRRIAASGSGPTAARRLSATWAGLRVPGMMHVTAGSPAIHLRKNWA